MTWEVSADPTNPDEAIAWFRARVPLTKPEWEALEGRARRRAFTVAGVAQLDLVAEVWTALDQALAEGKTFDDFRTAVGPRLAAAWGQSRPHRLQTIFRTNIQMAYSAGRYRQMTQPAVLAARPFWLYDAVLDSATTPMCRSLNGIVRPADDPWWDDHIPPLHFQCRSGIRTLTARQAEGKVVDAPDLAAGDGFGLVPDESEWFPLVEKLDQHPYDLARQFITQWAGGRAFDDFLSGIGPTEVPVAALPDALAREVDASSRTVRLSRDTLTKNQRHHPEIEAAQYRAVQNLIDQADLIVQDRDRSLVFLRTGDAWLYAALKSTRAGDRLYLTSLRYASERDITRSRQRGRVVRDRL